MLALAAVYKASSAVLLPTAWLWVDPYNSSLPGMWFFVLSALFANRQAVFAGKGRSGEVLWLMHCCVSVNLTTSWQ